MKKWILTDASTKQYGRKLRPLLYEFKEKGVPPTKIDLTNYTYGKISSICTAYYDDMLQLFDDYGKDSEWIIAECIFESEIL